MTAESNDGKTSKRTRPSGALRPSMVSPARVTPADAPSAVESVKGAPAAGVEDKVRKTKYSIQLDDADAVRFDELALVARRKLGRRVDKSELLRALLLLAADDASLRDQVIDQLRG